MPYIIREIPGEHANFGWEFEGRDELGNLFVITSYRGKMDGFNADKLRDIMQEAETLLDLFAEVEEGSYSNYTGQCSYKAAMEEATGIKYTPQKCHALKEWAKFARPRRLPDIAKYLTITTGQHWTVTSATGYSQGDFAEVLCPSEEYKCPKRWGEIWIGAAKEFCIIETDGGGNEVDRTDGYIVADCEAFRDSEYKDLLCNWAAIEPSETRLEMVDGCRTYTEYTYRAV